MASKKTREALKGALESLPVNPITLFFTSEIKPALLNTVVDGIDINSLPKTVTHSITVERLKGFQYSPEFVKLMEEFEHSRFYNSNGCVAMSRSGNAVKTTLSALTNSVSLLNFMLNNAVKLYMHAHEDKMDIGQVDRNYAEICGMLQHTDATKAYVSKSMTKSMKEDIKDISDMNKMQHTQTYANSSPLRSTKQALLNIVTPQALENFRQHEAEARKAKRAAIGYGK